MWANPWGVLIFTLALATGAPLMTDVLSTYAWAYQLFTLVTAFFVLCSFACFCWPTGAKLHISGPTNYQNHPLVNRWRMKVHNEGNSTAVNVQIRLRDIVPRPKYCLWGADYPYSVQLVSTVGGPQFACRINKNDAATFEIVSGWPNNGDFYTDGLDTKTSDNRVRIENDERWELKYDVIAENAAPKSFSMEMWVDEVSRAVMVRRKN
jgi:hypothetical protein